MKKVITFIVTGLILVGCGPKKPNFQEVDTPSKPLVQKGFSITPLNESDWYIIGRSPYQIALAKQGESVDETRAIQGTVFKINNFPSNEEFVRFVKRGQAQDTDISNPDRFKITTHDVVLREHKGEPCAYSHTITEDHGAVKRSNTKGFMTLEIFALVCRHPENRNAAISVHYSERYYPKFRNGDIETKANSLLDSFDFKPIQ